MKQITITGNVGKFEKRFTAENQPVLNFTVGVYDGKDAATQQSKTIWFSVSIYGKKVEYLEKSMAIGAKVTVWGELGINYYTTQDGQPRWNLKLNFADAEVMGKVEHKEASAPQDVQHPSTTQQQEVKKTNSDIPF